MKEKIMICRPVPVQGPGVGDPYFSQSGQTFTPGLGLAQVRVGAGCVRYLAQLDALRCVTFRPSDTIQGGRSLPAHVLPAEETEGRTK